MTGLFRKKNTAEYKAKLEKKLCIAKENPEPVFDLSGCGIKQIPNNIFSLCKVFRKDALYLQDNKLTSLNSGGLLQELKNLKILNISSNKFTVLPNSINFLECLEVLDVSNNQLLCLPCEIGELKKLTYLYLSYNNLKSLPDELGNCHNLEELYINCNKSIKEIPVTLKQLCLLRKLKIDAAFYDKVMKVFQDKINSEINYNQQEFENNSEIPFITITFKSLKMTKDNALSENLQNEKLKDETHEQKSLSMLSESLGFQSKLQDSKIELLDSIKMKQEEMDKKLCEIQAQKNENQALLIQLCKEEEKQSCGIVTKILKNNQKMRIDSFNLYLKEKEQEEKLLNEMLLVNKPSEKHQILASMNKTLEEEINKYHVYNDERKLGAIKSLAKEIALENVTFKELITKNKESKKQLLDSILADEELQKSAVASLLEKSDVISWECSRQIVIIEKKLAEMTKLEVFRKQVQLDCHLVELNENRKKLMKILMTLFEKQTKRRRELITRMQEMEAAREENTNQQNFWFQQYNFLLQSKSNEMVEYLESLNPKLVYQLFIQGVFHYLPLLRDFTLNEQKLARLNSESLDKVGIKDEKDRDSVLKAVQCFLNEEKFNEKMPTAPNDFEPSAPPTHDLDFSKNTSFAFLVPEECVICLDLQPNMLFVPCGHVCSCYKCSSSITLCPICRRQIDEKLDTVL